VAANELTISNNQCKYTGAGTFNVAAHSVDYTPPSDNDATVYPRLSAFAAGGDHALGTLAGDQAVCVRVDIGLDRNATNAVQTDSSTFDVQFDLNQHFDAP
jgi:hypothetical protein